MEAAKLKSPEAEPAMETQGALVFAMKVEARAEALFRELAAATADFATREIFQGLAREEAAHKRRFENEYDDLMHGGE